MHSLIYYIPVLSILLYIPFVCYSDYRSRSVPFLWYLPLILLNSLPLYLYFIESPPRNYWLFGLTIALCLILFWLAVLKAIGGGDFWFATFIMIFVPYNPFLPARTFFPLDFFWMLCLTAVYLPVITYIYNVWKRNRYTFFGMLTRFPDGFPYIIPISFAFIATLFVEMII